MCLHLAQNQLTTTSCLTFLACGKFDMRDVSEHHCIPFFMKFVTVMLTDVLLFLILIIVAGVGVEASLQVLNSYRNVLYIKYDLRPMFAGSYSL